MALCTLGQKEDWVSWVPCFISLADRTVVMQFLRQLILWQHQSPLANPPLFKVATQNPAINSHFTMHNVFLLIEAALVIWPKPITSQMMVACNNTMAMFQILLFHNTLHMEGIYCKNHHCHLYLFQDQHQTISAPMEGLSPLILLARSTKPILNTATKAMFTTTYNPQIQVELAIFHNILFPATHHHSVQMLMAPTVEASVLATWHPRLNILQHPHKHHLTATVPRWLGLQHTWSVDHWVVKIWKSHCYVMICLNTAPKKESEGKSEK